MRASPWRARGGWRAVAVAAAVGACVPSWAQVCTGWLAGEGIPGLAGAVNAGGSITEMVRWDPDGAGPEPSLVVAGGAFVQAGAVAASNIAAWDGRSWRALGSGMNAAVTGVVAASDGSLIAVGDFTVAGGTPANRVARWDGTRWSTLGAGLEQGTPYAVAALPGGRVVAGGGFRRAGGALAERVAEWDGTAWRPMGAGLSDLVLGLAVDTSGVVFAGGSFTASGGTAARRLARWDGSAWSEAGSGVNGTVYALEALPAGEIAVGGDFTTSNSGTAMSRVGVLGPGGWRALGAGVGGAVSGLRWLGDGRLFVGGGFGTAGGQPASCAALWDGAAWSGFRGLFTQSQGGSASVSAAALTEGGVLLAGSFDRVDTIRVRNAARWTHGAWQPAGPGLDTYASSVVRTPEGEFIFGGPFTVAGGQAAGGVAAWDGARWRSLAGGPGGPVNALALSGGRLYAAGGFQQPGLSRLAVWDGSVWSGVGGGVDDTVWAMIVTSRGDLIAGGSFAHAGGALLQHLARWDGRAWSPLAGGVNGDVTAILELPDGDLAVSGYFTLSGSTVLNGIGRFDGSAWHPYGAGFGGLPGFVHAETLLRVPNGDLVAGGWITTADGAPVGNIARWNGTAWTSFGTGMNSVVEQLVLLPGGDLVAAGWFSTAGGRSVSRVARWDGQEWWPVATGVGAGVVYGMTLLEDSSLVISGTIPSVQGRPDISNWGRWTLTGVPWVVAHPADAEVAEGGDVVLEAGVPTGFCGLSVRWRRDGAALREGPGGASPGGGDVSGSDAGLPCPSDGAAAALTIRGARAGDSGSYTAEFYGPCGQVVTRAAVVRIPAPCVADFNGDGFLDFFDYADFVACFEGSGCPSPGPLAADVNADGFVDFFDYGGFVAAFEAGC